MGRAGLDARAGSRRIEVVITRLVILKSMARWDKGAEIELGAVRAYPDSPDLYLIGAYAIRQKPEPEKEHERRNQREVVEDF